MKEITIIKPDDLHIHLRQGDAMVFYAKESANQFKRGIVMPNTVPPVTSVETVLEYKNSILNIVPEFEPLMTFKILPKTDPMDIPKLKKIGVIAGKYYPAGATTNSEDGISEWKIMRPVLKAMEDSEMVLSIHGEKPESFIMDREKDFLPIVKEMNREFPKLKIILEHVSSRDGVEFVKSMPENIVATVTLHHLLSTVEDVINNSANKCMPIPKLKEDRDSIREAVFSGDKKFFFGSDSAPHPKADKECLKAKAGVFTSPVLLPKLAELFENNSCLDRLEAFVSKLGADFYKIPYNEEKITIYKKDMVVPNEVYGVIPYLAGETISWSL
ncbi:MAG: dihydroorotase [Spirochaetales bacterium]|nr:dihydroorotase [Spirochaetales bacterium]